MKLKEGFIMHEAMGKRMLVAVGSGQFSGLVRLNAAAAFIVDCLKDETTPCEIIEKMLKTYDAPREILERDVNKILDQLRSINAIDE